MDGRDTPPTSGVHYIEALEKHLASMGTGAIATIMGRYYAMDRDNRWERVQKAYDALTQGIGTHHQTPREAMETTYDNGVTDEFIEPAIIESGFRPVTDGDSVIFFNFRPDRAREISRAFIDSDFSGFNRATHPKTHFVCLTSYDETIEAPVAFPKEMLGDVFAEVLSKNNLRQLHIAETEKYAHVTFFFNGGNEVPFPGEERILIDSPKVATYDLQPEMSAVEIGDSLVEAVQNDKADIYICNFANGDMVGHTGVFDAARKAVEVVDAQVGRIVDAVIAQSGVVLITADHGNAEQMVESDGTTPFTAHTCNTVPFIVVNSQAVGVRSGELCDVAPTILGLLGIETPKVWTGSDLLVY
jgi:2,3-bisphosphoglycerate-independent phosphoglycerate mutase